MSASHESGPLIVYGTLAPGTGGSEPEAGPSMFFQGQGVLDERIPYAPGVTGVGKIFGALNSGAIIAGSQIPATLSTTKLAAAAAVNSGVAMTLVSAFAYGVQPKMQLVPLGSARNAANVVSNLLGIDVGFGSCTIAAGAKSVTAFLGFAGGGTQQLYRGMPVWIGGAGTSGAPLFTRVDTVSSATAFTVFDAAVTSVTAQPIGCADENLVTYDPWRTAGAGKIFDPYQGFGRCINIVATNAGATGGAFTVVGYDIWGNKVTQTVTHVGAATTIIAQTAIKFLLSVTPGFTDAQSYSVGTSDVYGLPFRSDLFEDTLIHMAGALITANTGWVAGVTTDPATLTTADPRGRYTVQTASNGTAADTGRRLRIAQMLAPQQFMMATPSSAKSMFGVTPFFS